ncbi:MAG: hypothetical protein EOP49_11410, partial [Sphingobacteriales bacterium]
MKKALIALVVLMVLVLGALAFRHYTDKVEYVAVKARTEAEKQDKDKDDKKDKKKKDGKALAASGSVAVEQQWDLPDILEEVSAIAYLGAGEFACVQDERGIVYVYSTTAGKILHEIPFGPSGDYEGLAVAGQTAYVLRADGQIFEVKNFDSGKPSTTTHKTSLTAKQDTEGMCYDASNNRLLIAIKGAEPGSTDYKGIYSFSLADKK